MRRNRADTELKSVSKDVKKAAGRAVVGRASWSCQCLGRLRSQSHAGHPPSPFRTAGQPPDQLAASATSTPSARLRKRTARGKQRDGPKKWPRSLQSKSARASERWTCTGGGERRTGAAGDSEGVRAWHLQALEPQHHTQSPRAVCHFSQQVPTRQFAPRPTR